MGNNVDRALQKLKSYCESQNFKGWDPYDGLNSKIFRLTPFKYWDLARLAWIQGFKRSPINLRKILFVPKEYNAKGIALLLNGYCNLYRLSEKGREEFGKREDLLSTIILLSDKLIELQNTNYSGACWGYNFDWQARRLFLFPKNTPTVVATSFCVEALLMSYEITRNKVYLNTALSASAFILNDLKRTPFNSGFLFSYSPLEGNNTVINASLLGAKTLALIYKYEKNDVLKSEASKTIRACCEAQRNDGSWVYGMLEIQSWIDSFHTGYNLDAIQTYQNCTGDNQFDSYLEKGFVYYINTFFLTDGTPKYYSNKTYPIDIHCPAQLFVNLHVHGKFEENKEIAQRVLDWSIKNMQDVKGYFYYQLKPKFSSKISYMRWSNAFMFRALTCYLIENDKQKNK